MSATIKDIRNETGLALSTISKYLNGKNVRKENAALIEGAIQKLDYHRNELARALITKQTKTISFIVNDITSQFCGVLVRYAGEYLRRQGYSLIFCDSDSDERLEDDNIRFCLEKNVDGILLIPLGLDVHVLDAVREAGVPLVLIDRDIPGADCDCVLLDNRSAAVEACQYLIGRGHTKIASIYSEEYTGRERNRGFLSAMEQAGLFVDERYLYSEQRHSSHLGYTGMKRLLALEDPPTAVLLSNYEANLGAVMALNEAGMHIPEEISLIGFDELVFSLVMRPKMTVMAQPMEEMCIRAVDLLLSRIASGEQTKPERIILPATLKERESVQRI